MEIRQYIGARYTPKFMGTYDNTQVYEALSVVDNGLGTSYICGKPTPADTPLTDTEYWHIYGASSGAIINLQNQIGDLTDLDTTDKDSLVDAINENVSEISALTHRIIMPEQFGAVGDGVTDDTQALQDCLDLGGFYGKFGATYLISDALTVSDNTVIEGNFSTIKVANGVDISFIAASGDPKAMLTIDDVSNVTIKDLIFDCNGSSLPVFSDDTLYTNVGVSVTGQSNDVVIDNCKFVDIYTTAIRGNDFVNLSVNDCYFKHTVSNQNLRKECVYIINKPDGILNITNNMIDEEVISRIYAPAGIYLANVDGAVIEGNTILNCGRSGGGGLHPLESISLYQTCKNITIKNNTIKSIGSAVRLDNAYNVDFSGNNVEFVGTDTPSYALLRLAFGTDTLTVFGNINISNNKLIDNGTCPYVIAISGSGSIPVKGINIESNYIIGNECIHVEWAVNELTINHNVLKKATTNARIVVASGCENVIVDGNTIDDGYIRLRTNSSAVIKNSSIINNKVAVSTDTAVIMARNVEACIVANNQIIGGTYSFNNADMDELMVHDNAAKDLISGTYAYYGSNALQHDNYLDGVLVTAFQ